MANSQKPTQVAPYTEAQVRRWLAFLARNMQQHTQTIFLIEQLQPNWLATHFQQKIYIVVTRFLSGLLIGMIVGIIIGFKIGATVGLISGGVTGIFEILRMTSYGERLSSTTPSLLLRIQNVFVIALIIWLPTWFIGSVSGRPFDGFIHGLIFGAVFVVTYSPLAGRKILSDDIHTVELLIWSLGRALKYGVLGLMTGLVTGLVFELIYRLTFDIPWFGNPYTSWWLKTGLLVAAAGSLSGIIRGGLISQIMEIRTIPNQGIRLSLWNCIFAGVIAGAIIGVFGGISGNFFGEIVSSLTGISGIYGGLFGGLIIGLSAGLLVALWYGGFNVLQHGIIRLLLWWRGDAPLNYARFLDYAASDLHFLQRVGGGYIFVHRYLLEHFAAMAEEGE